MPPWKLSCAMLPSNGGKAVSDSRRRGRNYTALLELTAEIGTWQIITMLYQEVRRPL
jgi:hypothetical protein